MKKIFDVVVWFSGGIIVGMLWMTFALSYGLVSLENTIDRADICKGYVITGVKK